MTQEELKTLVAGLLRELQPPAPSKGTVSPPTHPTECRTAPEDLTEMDLRRLYLTKQPARESEFLALKAKTPARLGMGRAGTRYLTATQLRFRADHAAAQDSVFSRVRPDFAAENSLVAIRTRCQDKDEYLTRPDLGRQFDESASLAIRQAVPSPPRVQLVIGDGLSSAAIEANAIDCAGAIAQGLKAYGIELGKSLFVEFCRVGAGDAVGDLTGCEVVCVLVGERPGLVTAESMSAYLTYRPHAGIAESARTVVSNIHRQGTPAVEAGAHIAQLLHTILEKKASGVALQRELAQ